ncbi:cytochrome c oxidase assembly protein [Sphingomicrobium marinum]|uniref:cytochrome c oxidase assembly protein n=1 Tax=Sphingomicrobium marinum TaxID=1227950 RepID=UPI00223F938A|nr:cytochrome c oxidase assembly protein [Sphingomicrobium marinum]
MTSAALGNANAKTALKMALFALGMLGLAFASVPLYRVFCQVTGFGGTTQVAATAPGAVAGEIGVRFDANVNGVPWRFKPKQTTVRIAPGARTQVAYEATSLVARPTSGTATFNVTPAIAGQYFSKIECFCFTEQTLEAGQSVDMPVIFFVDPAIKEDPDTAHIDEITLSYTFFPLEKQAASR